jgi:signal peptidase
MGILAGTMTALRRIVDLALIVLIVIVLFGVILGKVVPLTGRQTIIIGGASMEPAIRIGSAIVIAPVRPTDLSVGDVVSLQVGADRATFTHRIVAVVPRDDGIWIRTKGDANAEPDPTLVPASSILGREEWAIPFAGYLMALLSLPIGVVFILGLAATLVAIAWLLESLEPDTERVVIRQAPDASRGEPIAARPSPGLVRSFRQPGPLAGGLVTATPAGTGSYATAARPTVREQLERSRDVRTQRADWRAGRSRSDRDAD